MAWVRLFEVAARDLDSDAPVLRKVLDDAARIASCTGKPYRLDAEAHLAMGWWFFSVYVQEEFVRAAVERMHAEDPKAEDERALLGRIREGLSRHGSTAKVNLHQDKRSIFARYWTWLIR